MFSAFLDTCVLVPSTLRDLLLELGTTPAYRPLWSDKIEDELKRVVQRHDREVGRDPDETEAKITRLIRSMNRALPDARIVGWKYLVDGIEIKDQNDRHVVAAAIHGRADVVVTFNLRDFEGDVLPGQLLVQSPNEFLQDLLDLYPSLVFQAVEAIVKRSGRKGPKWTEGIFLDCLKRNKQLKEFVDAYREERGT